MRPRSLQGRALLVLLVLATFAIGAFAADPIKVTVAVTGTAVPGATVTAKATVTTTDSSTVQSIEWKQVAGPTASLTNALTDTVTIGIPDRKAFRDELMLILEEPPTTNLPSNVPMPDPYEGGLQDRFVVAGVAPLALEEAGELLFELTVKTSSGTYHAEAPVPVTLPFTTSIGVRNVPTLVPVLIHGKTQATYNWVLTPPTGSKATLLDGTTQNPEFTPDMAGTYKLTVTDLATSKPVELTVIAGTWRGVIVGQDSSGRPVSDPACLTCHVPNTPNFDMFTPWAKSGHAEIFTQNVTTPNGHYSTGCLSCHSVGYDTNVKNGGMDDAPDFAAFLQTDLLTHGAADNWTKILAQFPATAKLANIQCENCHGPQDSAAHSTKNGSRVTISSDVCGSCHGEPARHGRFQQWQLSGHANFELAREEGTDPSCGKCHSGQGFLAWEQMNFNNTTNLTVDWTEDDVQPQTCAVCHDPHAVGTTSGGPTTNATVRVSGDTPLLMSGYTATGVGRAAICMTCHNGRRGLKNDANFTGTDLSRAPHVGPQADILMGQNLYFATTGKRGLHAMIEDSCVTCHMEKTPPPADLSYQLGGTNHTFFADKAICSKCHSSITYATTQTVVQGKMDSLKLEIEKALLAVMQGQIRAGNTIDLNGTKVKVASDLKAVEFIESHGRQGANVTLSNGTKISDMALNTIKSVPPAGTAVEILAVTDPALAKAGWNYWSVNSDASKGVHNPAFVNQALDVSLYAVKAITTTPATGTPATSNPAVGGGLGTGAGAVSCTGKYVYWAEIAAHTPGLNNSQWRTDMVARNLGSATASLNFVLHQPSSNLQGTGTINGGSQKAFEDIVAMLGGTDNKGSLEICSDQPLLVNGRIFNQADGTFGQNIDGHVADLGYTAGQTVSLIGLRQKTNAFRTNISVTNGGTTDATVSINLFNAAGTSLTSYTITVPAGQVVQEGEVFKNRANAPDVDWGFATVTVVKGTNIRTSASVIDFKTNDPTTIPPKQ